MAAFSIVRMASVLCVLLAASWAAWAQGNYAVEGVEYNVAGVLPGEQMQPRAAIGTTGGYLVWQDNITDGAGLGVSAVRLDGSLSAAFSSFRVNEDGAFDQEKPAVAMLNDGGAVFVWLGGKTGFQRIYARFMSAAGTWTTGDVLVNTTTNVYQVEPALAVLTNGNVVVVWSSLNQAGTNSMRDVYCQVLSPAGVKLGAEMRVNQVTAYNQRSAAVAALSDGRFVVVWISEQQRSAFSTSFNNDSGAAPSAFGTASVDVYARVFTAAGAPVAGEFLVNNSIETCASPDVARSSDGGFAVTWMQRDLSVVTNSWDIYFRPVALGGANQYPGVARRVNTRLIGDQYSPRISAMGTDYLVVWNGLGQDGSREGVFGQFLRGDGTPLYTEFRVNSTAISQQLQPAVASDGVERFFTVWTSFVGGTGSFDLYAQRYVNTNAPIPAPGVPIVTVLSSNALSVSWPAVQGYSVLNYEVYADGAGAATAVVTNTYWNATGLAPASTHSYRLAYVVADGRRSPLSSAAENTTYHTGTHGGIPRDWVIWFFGDDSEFWPGASVDSDGDGASNRNEFLAGTDPTDPNSVLKVRLQPSSQGLFLNWNTQVGLVYQVQSSSLPGGTWTNVGGPRFAAGAVDSLYVGGGAAGFYRIVRLR